MTNTTQIVPVEKFGRDHWSTLLYVETRCVDAGGVIDEKMRMRCDPDRHPEHATLNAIVLNDRKYPTRLADGTNLDDHDDWDCLDDMAAAGWLIVGGTTQRPVITLTDEGWRKAAERRRHVAESRR